MSVYLFIRARFTFNVRERWRHLEGSIPLKWVIWYATFFFACRAQDYTFCLLIVRYMFSDKIKGKSALKARTFLHVVRDKVHACYWYKLSGKQCRLPAACSNIFKTFHGSAVAQW